MKNNHTSKSGFFYPRICLTFLLSALGALLVTFSVAGVPEFLVGNVSVDRDGEHGDADRLERDMPVPGGEVDDLNRLELEMANRVTYPTGKFDPAWVRRAAQQDARIARGIPFGARASRGPNWPLALDPNNFTALGPQPEHMTGCTGCFDYGITEGRTNAIVVDPTTTTPGSIVAYMGTNGGGVWKTTNCCNGATSWTSTTDGALISTTSVDTLAIDPNNHNTIYAGTGDLNYGSFSQGSQGILKSTDGAASWTVLAPDIFGAALPQPAGQFPQYQAVGKVRVDPNNSNNVVAGTKTGLYFSYNGGTDWTGPCTTNGFSTQRQDITGLELTNVGGTTRILAAVGVRGFATTVQYNLDQNGANGLYKGTMPVGGCPSDFALITRNDNGFIFGDSVTGSAYATGAPMNAGGGTPYGGVGTGVQNGRMEIAVAPSDPNYIYIQIGSIAANSNGGCGNTSGCQLGVWSTTDGGDNWSFMAGSAGGALRNCSNGQGDYPQNWYDQGIAIDPNNPERIFVDTFDVWFATRTGTSFYDLTCGYSGGNVVHVDQHALAFVAGSSSILLKGSDGGVFSSSDADTAVSGTRNTWINMDNGVNTIEFYSGDISGNFANDPNPAAVGGAQDNGPSSVTFSGTPTGPVQWQEGLGGDGFSGQIDPMGAGLSAAKGAISLTSGGALDGETFMIGTQTFTFQTGPRTGTGEVQISTSTTTEGNNIVAAINADIPAVATATRSGSTVTVTATVAGPAGNAIPFTESATNITMNGSGFLGGSQQGGLESGPRFWEGNNSGGLSRCIFNCTSPGASWASSRGSWTGDQQSFVLPINLFHGGIPGGDDCGPAGADTGCGHLIAGTTRVWETISGAAPSVPSSAWYVTNDVSCSGGTNPCLTKGTLGNRSFINQVKYSPKFQSVAIVGTNDGNVQIGFNLGTGVANEANWVNVTGGNIVLPNRPILGISLDPSVATTDVPVGYAAVGGFNFNTPTTPGHVFQVTCAPNCSSFIWADKTGNLPDIPVDSIINNPNYPQQVYAGTDFGVYYTDNINVSSPVWNRFQNGLPNAMIWDMGIDRGATTLAVFTRSRGAFVWPLPSGAVPVPEPTAVVSRKTHGAAGIFDIDLMAPAPGIECRSGGATGDHTMVVTFATPVTVSGNGTAKGLVTSGSGNVGSGGTANGNAVTVAGNQVTVQLTNIADAQTLNVTLYGVNDGTNVGNVSIPMKVLFGDTTASGDTNGSDVSDVKANSGHVVDSSNFRTDVIVNGLINSSDVSAVKAVSGVALRPVSTR